MNREVATWRDHDSSRGERFTYEPTNQLSHIDYNAQNAWTLNPTGADRTVSYAYAPDKLNRSSMTDNGQVTNYSPDPLNQYTAVGAMSYQYDSNFNLTYTGAFSGVYDAANRLVSASNGGSGEAQQTVAGFVYDGLGRCVKRTLNGVATIFVYDGWKPIGEWDVWGYFQAWNVYGPGEDEILLRHWGKYGYLRFQLDRHGNVEFLLNNNGALLEKYKYDAFGKPAITDAADNPRSFSYYGHCFLFQGREYIWQFGIYDYRNRFYHPATGRFLQTDPTGFGAGDMNLFRYVNDDPIDGSDPTGLGSELVGDRMFKSACFFDSGNSYQGSYNEFMGNSQPGGDAAGTQGAPKSVAAEHEGRKVQWSNEGNRNQHEPIVHDKTGRSYNALTEDAVRVTAENDTLTAHYIVNVRYSDNVGPHNKEKQKLEAAHGNELDRDFRNDRGPKIIESFTRRGGPLEGQSLETARSMLEHRLDVARQAAHDASHERHDNTNPLKGPLGDHVLIHSDGLNY
jgi:RHS repeat-associated protein